MNTENTLENKAKFFSLYWGQELGWLLSLPIKNSLTGKTNKRFDMIDSNLLGCVHEDSCVILTPLSQISDEDAIEVAKIMEPYFEFDPKETGFRISIERTSKLIRIKTGNGLQVLIVHTYADKTVHIYTSDWKEETRVHASTILESFDFLRSHGYALPWMGISVEKQTEYGWVKLKEVQNG